MERKTAARVDQDIEFARQNGINATPTAFLNGRRTQVVAAEQLRALIRQLRQGADAFASTNETRGEAAGAGASPGVAAGALPKRNR